MSFTLNVHVQRLPTDADWLAAIGRCGLTVRPADRFSLSSWRGGLATFSIQGGGGTSRADLELDIGPADPEELSDLVAGVEPPVAARLRAARFSAMLATSASRSETAFRLQCFAAAALAVLGDGVLHDPQEGVLHSADQAYAVAADMVAAYEPE